MEDNRVRINPSDVLGFLQDGKTREEIREHYNLSKSDAKRMFEHPMLKGRKTRKAPGFVFEEEEDHSEAANNIINVTSSNENVEEDVAQDDAQEDQPAQWNN